MSRPAMSSLRVRWGKEKPSYTGQMWVTPSPESTTTPVSKPGDRMDSQQSDVWHICRCEFISVAWLSGFNMSAKGCVSYPEHTEWAQLGLPHRCCGTGTSQTWPLWSSPGSWWGSWAAQSAGSRRKTRVVMWLSSCEEMHPVRHLASGVLPCILTGWCSSGRDRRCGPTGAACRPNSAPCRSPWGRTPPAWSDTRWPRHPPSGPVWAGKRSSILAEADFKSIKADLFVTPHTQGQTCRCSNVFYLFIFKDLTLITKFPTLLVDRMIGRPTMAGKMWSGKLDPAKPHLTNCGGMWE